LVKKNFLIISLIGFLKMIFKKTIEEYRDIEKDFYSNNFKLLEML